MDYCFGCGCRIWTPKNEHESGDWCSTGGNCTISDFEGVNRFREFYLDHLRSICVHEWISTRDGEVESCAKCHALKPT